jgi:mannose-1-phosphate guanylyltransferase
MANSPPLVVVILAGGAGTRFWPSSTDTRPKQFLRFFGPRSLFQQAYDRVQGLVPDARILVVTGRDFVDLCQRELPSLPSENIIGEPARRDTAGAIALAVAIAEHRFGEHIMAVLTSDHLIGPTDVFQRSLLSAALGASSSNALYTFGIPPTYPATGFGYLELGERVRDDDGIAHFALARFVEKPSLDVAQQYVESGRFLWNSGMFVWNSRVIASEFERVLPEHLRILRPAVAGGNIDDAFLRLPKVSIDYGLMEKAQAVRALRAPFQWSDVGSFAALADHLPKEDGSNAARGRLFTHDARGNVVFSEDDDEVFALVGVQDLIVVRAGKRTLVVPRDRAEDVKKLVDTLSPDLKK